MTNAEALSPVLILDNYDSFTYNLYQMVQALTEASVLVYRNNALTRQDVVELQPSHLIISPGPGHPAVPQDVGLCGELLADPLPNLPVLGVCLGHQGMAAYQGGHVIQAPHIMHGKTSLVDILVPACPLFEGLPNPVQAMRYHSLVVDEDSLPRTFEITARDRLHGLIMGMQHRRLPFYGVQFHPESIGTPEGSHLLGNFLTRCH